MIETFIFSFLGHQIGDFLLQGKKMALQKSEKGWKGFWICTLHVVIYTASVCLMVSLVHKVTPEFALAVFIPHWIIDRYSLASVWLKFIKGRTFKAAHESTDQYREFDVAFTSIVYAETDRTFHLLSLVGAIYKFL